LGPRSDEGFGVGVLGLRRSYARPSDGDVVKSRSGAVRLSFTNHLGREGGVIGELSVGDGFVKSFSWMGCESSGCIENEFSVLFMPDDLRRGVVPGFGEGETPHVLK
jgi:hypothetical protein